MSQKKKRVIVGFCLFFVQNVQYYSHSLLSWFKCCNYSSIFDVDKLIISNFARNILYMDTVKNVSFNDIAVLDKSSLSWIDNIIVYDEEILNGIHLLDSNNPPIRIEGLNIFLCKYGRMSFSIDYKPYQLKENTLLCLQSRHIVDDIHVSSNCKGCVLVISPDLIQLIIKDIPAIKKLTMSTSHLHPLEQLEEDEMAQLVSVVERIKKNLKATNHSFQNYITKNEVSNFLLEIANIRIKKNSSEHKGNNEQESRQDEIVNNFIQFILDHCREQHEVAFYAKKLYMTPGNLSRTMKNATGKSPLKWINDILIAEAKILLRRKDVNVQQVSEELHFGDQSSFGKFFKKHIGLTPIEYRNRVRKV